MVLLRGIGLLVFEVLFNQQSRFTVRVVNFVEMEHDRSIRIL